MKKTGIIFSLFVVLLGVLQYSGNFALKAASETAVPLATTDAIPTGFGIITSRTMPDGRLATSNLGIFGPDSCTHMGDPYSPLDSIYAPGPYTLGRFLENTLNPDVLRIKGRWTTEVRVPRLASTINHLRSP